MGDIFITTKMTIQWLNTTREEVSRQAIFTISPLIILVGSWLSDDGA